MNRQFTLNVNGETHTVDADPDMPLLYALRDTFAQGLDAYRQQNWETATAQFETCRRLAPDDGPSRVYLERIAHLRCNPPPPDWDGVWRLAAK